MKSRVINKLPISCVRDLPNRDVVELPTVWSLPVIDFGEMPIKVVDV